MATNSLHEEFYDSDAEQQRSVKGRTSSQEITPEIREMKSIIQRLQIQLQQEVNTSKRLRHQRDQHRSTAKELASQIAQLQPQEEMYDSDEEEQEPVEKKVTSLLQRTKKNLHSQYPTINSDLQAQRLLPASQQFDTKIGLAASQGQGFEPASQGSNKHYPDVPEFYGDPTEWEAWQLHLDSKFRASAMLFPTDQSRIDYIRDHCKSTAFNVIKARCLRDAPDPYTSADEMLGDLNNMYGEFDAYGKADATLHSPDFGMQKNETFDEFLARYTATIAPLQLPEQSKISQLTRTITRRLRFLTINGIKPVVFKDYVQRLRQCDLNMRLTDQQHGHRYHEEFDGYSTDRSSESSKSNKSYRTSKTTRSRGYFGTNQHSEETLERLRHEGKCYRCQKSGHMATDQDAPCKGKAREKAIEKD